MPILDVKVSAPFSPALVERIGYDGAAQQISIRFRAAGEEAPA